MAFDLGKAVGRLILDSAGVVMGSKQAMQSMSGLSDVYKKNFFALRDLGTMSGSVSTTIAAGFASAAKSAIDFERSMAGVARTTFEANLDPDPERNIERNNAELAKMKDALLDLSSVKPSTPEDLAKIAEEAGALGIRGTENIKNVTSVVADLAATTDLSADDATSALARISNIMGNTSAQFKNMGSTVLELGRSTASTEPEIVAMARRIAGAGKTVGLSTDQVLAYAAALASVGVREEQGGSAISRTFIDLQEAVSEGGDILTDFGKVAGMSGQDFAKAFEQDAGRATNTFIQGLGRLQTAGVDIFGVLKDLGITEIRQRDALLRLASAQGLLAQTLDTGSQAWKDNTALAEISGRVYGTADAQLKILNNTWTQAKIAVGDQFVPVIKLVVAVLNNLMTGFNSLSPVAKTMVTVMLGAIGVLTALGSAAVFLVPRLVAMRIALTLLAQTAPQMATAITAATRASLVLTAILGAATIAMIVFGKKSKESLAGLEKGKQIVEGFAGAMTGSKKQQEDSIKLFIAQQIAANHMQDQLKALGLTAADVYAHITRAAEAGFKSPIEAKLTEARNAFNDGKITAEQYAQKVDKLSEFINHLSNAHSQAKLTVEQHKQSLAELGIETEENTEDSEKLRESYEKRRETIEKVAQAQYDLVDAIFAQRGAERSVADAALRIEELNKKRLEQVNDIAKAENQLAQAQLNEEQAAWRLVDAQSKLATARADALEDEQQAERDLEDAHYNYERSVDRIREAEEKLEELRQGPTLKEMRDATLDLKRAQDQLQGSVQSVADAEWQLNYLRQEGASDRDIAEAEEALEDARLDVEESSANLTDAEDKLQDLRDGADPEAIRDAEREVADAYRASRDASREIQEAERNLAEQRLAVSTDRAYREAEIELRTAELGVRDAQLSTVDALNQLHIAQAGGNFERELAAANDELQQAYYRLAQANVEVQKQTALSRGETWDLHDSNVALGNQLIDLGRQLGGPMGQELINHGIRLRNAGLEGRNAGDDIYEGMNTGAAGANNVASALGGVDQALDDVAQATEDNDPWWERWWHAVTGWIGSAWDYFTDFASDIGSFFGNLFDGPLGGLLSGVGDFFSVAAPGTGTDGGQNTIAGYQHGGLSKRRQLAWLSEKNNPELILPLDDLNRSFQLLSDSGLLNDFANRGMLGSDLVEGRISGQTQQQGGDVINIRTVVQDAGELAREMNWTRRTRKRA